MNLGEAQVGTSLRELVAQRLGAERFGLWFAACDFSAADSVLTIRVPNRFVQECIRRNCLAELQEFASELLGPTSSLTFELNAAELVGPRLAAIPKTNGETKPKPSKEAPSNPPPSRRKFSTFENFVVGPPNQLACTAAQIVVENPGQMNPLYLHGPVGVGKTHLLEAVWSASRQRRRPVLYLTAEQFTSDFVSSMQGGLPSFRRKYRSVDMLLIDDLQFFQGKRATSQELLFTISGLVSEGRQVVLSGDRSPPELVELGEEFISRLVGGMVCRMEPANFAMRSELVEQLALKQQTVLPPEVREFIAEHLTGNARELSGAVNRLQATQRATGEPITLSSAQQALRDLIQHSHQPIRIQEIERVVCELYDLTSDQLHSRQRAKSIVQARMVVMWLARHLVNMAYREIGTYLGQRSHSTAISACQQVDSWRESGQTLQLGSHQVHVEEALRQIKARLELRS